MKIKFMNLLFPFGKVLLLYIMRLFIFLFCTTLFSFTPSTAFSQGNVVIDTDKNITVDEVFDLIKQQTDYTFIYREDLFKNFPNISLKKGTVSVEKLLKISLKAEAFNYQFVNNTIVITKILSKQQKKLQQPGKIRGTVVDENGNPLSGATIAITATGKGTMSDFDGNYEIVLPTGSYTVEVSYISFQAQRITEVVVKPGATTQLNVVLKENIEALKEVVLSTTVTYREATSAGLLAQQKKAAQLSDGISAEQIAKTPDNEVGSTLKRITGVTTVDNKYVVVRSMGERWNQAAMDGLNLPSTDAYQQHFSFDIIPTALVESVVVSKTVTPDMNANFAGGYVEIKTKDIPRENFNSFTMSSSYNSRSTFKDHITKQRGKYDYFGFDDGTRDYPNIESMDPPITEAEAGPYIENSKKFTQDNFTNYKEKAPLNSAYQFALGRAYQLRETDKWGFVGAVTLRNTQSVQEIEHTERGQWMTNTLFYPVSEDREYYTLEQYGYKNHGASYTYNATLAGMLNAGIQLGKHRFSIRNTYTHIYDNQLTQITGWDYYSNSQSGIRNGSELPLTETVDYPVYQTFIQNKIEGEHRLGKITVDWFAARSHTSKDTKDATFMENFRIKQGDDVLTQYLVSNSGTHIHRDYYWNKETDYNWGANLKWDFNLGSTRNMLKAGYFGTIKKAENQQIKANLRWLVEDPAGKFIYISTPFSELLDGSYYTWDGFGWDRYNFYGDKYEGKVEVHAPFLMLDNKFTSWLRLIWGLRAESYVYTQLQSQRSDESYTTEQLDDKKWQYLPSIGLVISPTEKTNIRLGYNKSVIRPQFSERLQVPYYDPIRSALVLANWSGVISTVAENYDFKLEWFPHGGEILSAGIYYKDIQDPIEAVTRLTNEGARRIHTLNSVSAKLWGVELEIRKNLSFMGEGKALDNFFISGNATFNKTKVVSYVNLDGSGGTYEANRPMYGQTPYSYNLGLDYTGERFGFSLRHNASGEQYLTVGFDYYAEEIRMPYSTTDGQISWKFLPEKNMELKLSVSNLFDSVYETYNNVNSYTGPEREGYEYGDNPRERYTLTPGASDKYDEGIDRKLFKSYIGRTFSFSIHYNF